MASSAKLTAEVLLEIKDRFCRELLPFRIGRPVFKTDPVYVWHPNGHHFDPKLHVCAACGVTEEKFYDTMAPCDSHVYWNWPERAKSDPTVRWNDGRSEPESVSEVSWIGETIVAELDGPQWTDEESAALAERIAAKAAGFKERGLAQWGYRGVVGYDGA